MNQEYCESCPYKFRQLNILSIIVMELIQDYSKEDGVIDVNNINQWPFDFNTIDFLSMMKSIISVIELMKIY